MSYFTNKTDVVQYVDATTHHLKVGSRLTMTILPMKSGGYYVTSVIEELSAGTVKKHQRPLKPRTNT